MISQDVRSIRSAVALAAVSLLVACQSNYETTASQIVANQLAREQVKLTAVARADMKTSEARGKKDCHIRQMTSAFLVRQRLENKATTGYSFGSDVSEIFVKVHRSGSVGIAVTEDTYPGSNAYFLIDGKRYVGDGDEYTNLDSHGLSALKRDVVVKFSWTNWPHRNEINREDVLAGFESAYNECLVFLRS